MAEPHEREPMSPDVDQEPESTAEAPIDQDPTLVAGRYRIERTLGRGGGGHVWLATDETLGRQVALKRVAGEADTSVLLDRGMREARTSATLAHEHVVRVYDAFEHEGSPWIVMEYVDGYSLAEVIEDDTRLSPRRAAAIGAQVATALATAHRAGILHRDVKPANVLLAADGDGDDAKLTDFGIARAEEDPHLTRTGFVSGTAAYFSPELARGESPSAASDVWALGASLYAAVEGERPFPSRSNAVAQLHTIVNEQVRPPQRAGELTPVLAGMLDPNPDTRWDAARAAAALRTVAAGGSVADGSHGAGPSSGATQRWAAGAAGAAAAGATAAGARAAGGGAADADYTQAVPHADPTRTFARQQADAASPAAEGAVREPRTASPADHARRAPTGAPPPRRPVRTEPPRAQRHSRRSMWLGWLIAVPLLALLGWLVWNIASGLDGGGPSVSQDPATPVSSNEASDLAQDFYSTLADDGYDAARDLMTDEAWLPTDIAQGLVGVQVDDLQASEQGDGSAQVTAVVTYTYGASTIAQDETLGISRATGDLLITSRSAIASGGQAPPQEDQEPTEDEQDSEPEESEDTEGSDSGEDESEPTDSETGDDDAQDE